MKKVLSILLCVCILFSNISPVYAMESNSNNFDYCKKVPLPEPTVILIDEEPERAASYSLINTSDMIEVLMELSQRVKEALLSGDEFMDIDISDLNLNMDAHSYVNSLAYYCPYLVGNMQAAVYYYSSGAYAFIRIDNPYSVSEVRSFINKIDNEIDSILENLSDDMSDVDKSLIVHDALVYRYEYEYDNLNNGTLTEDSFRSGGMLLNKTGVCNAYAYLYMYLLHCLGIECDVVSSDTMYHAWNVVKLNNKYYHVDCTFDDPVEDKLGKVSHWYFLISDTTMKTEKDHHGWDESLYSCNDMQYEDDYWVYVDSQIIYGEDEIYYIDSYYDEEYFLGEYFYIVGMDKTTNEITDYYFLDFIWSAGGGAYWPGLYSGFFMVDNTFYCNSEDTIYALGLDGEVKEVFHLDDTSNGYIYGIRENGTKIQYALSASPNHSQVIYETGDVITRTEEEEPIPSVTEVFQDIHDYDWYVNSVQYVYENGMMSGYNGYFNPEDTMTRAMVVTTLYRLNGEPMVTDYTAVELFADVMPDQWYTDAICWAYNTGITTGYAGTAFFGTDDSVTREQVATFLYRYTEINAYDTSASADISGYKGNELVSEYAVNTMRWAVGIGLISGEERYENGVLVQDLNPQGSAIRAQMATILMRFCEHYGI